MRTVPLLPRFSHQTAPFFTCQSAPAAPIASAAASPIVDDELRAAVTRLGARAIERSARLRESEATRMAKEPRG